jgi:O-antigen/teichoic acid export membrane protein
MTASSNAAQTVARNSAIVLAAQIGVKALSFLFTVYVVRQLGPEAFGTYTAIGAFGFLFIFVADLGLSTYAVREVARLRDQPEGGRAIADLHADLLLLRIVLALLSGGLTVAFGWATGLPADMMLGLALNVIGLTLSGVQSASGVMLGGFERMDVGAWGMMLNQLMFVALGALALWGGYGFLGLIVANLIAIAITTAYIVAAARAAGIGIGHFRPARWSALLRASLPFGIVTFALGLSYKFDTVLLELTRSSTETGLYNAAYNLIFTCVVLSNVINTSLYPTLSRLSVSTPERLTGLYARALRFLWTAAFPIAIGGFLLAGDLVPFLFDSAYTTAAIALRILIWAVPLMYTTEFLGYVILIANRERLVARSVLVSTGLNVVANLVVVPIFGFVGAAVVTVATETVLVCQYVWLLRDQLRGMDLSLELVRPLLAAGLMGLVVSLLPAGWHVLLKVALGAGMYGLCLLPLGLVSREDLALLRRQ